MYVSDVTRRSTIFGHADSYAETSAKGGQRYSRCPQRKLLTSLPSRLVRPARWEKKASAPQITQYAINQTTAIHQSPKDTSSGSDGAPVFVGGVLTGVPVCGEGVLIGVPEGEHRTTPPS